MVGAYGFITTSIEPSAVHTVLPSLDRRWTGRGMQYASWEKQRPQKHTPESHWERAVHDMRSQTPLARLHREFWGQVVARASVQASRAQWPSRHSWSAPQLVGVHGGLQARSVQTSPVLHCESV